MSSRAALWLADADAVSDEALQRYRGWLAPGELEREARFTRRQRRCQFIVGRVLLRMALGRLLGVASQAVHLDEQAGRAPKLVAPLLRHGGPVPGFSIAHSGRWVACAVSADAALGLDIELLDSTRDLSALAEQAFDAQEMARWSQMDGLDKAGRMEGFYRLWSEKEARFKLGRSDAGSCLALPHAELSVVLCSVPALTQAPRIEVVTLP
jgi:4'-phosphopantetheinyl transferase